MEAAPANREALPAFCGSGASINKNTAPAKMEADQRRYYGDPSPGSSISLFSTGHCLAAA
eukprot:917772-Rhodomonas_salina.2